MIDFLRLHLTTADLKHLHMLCFCVIGFRIHFSCCKVVTEVKISNCYSFDT